MTVLEMNDLSLRQGCQQLHVVLENVHQDANYGIFLSMANVVDSNPRSFPGMIVTGKDRTGFYVDLGHTTDSPNYKLCYVVIDKEQPIQMVNTTERPMTITMPEAAKKLPPLDIKVRCFSHKWKHYHGIMESYDYCEVCDEKRF